VIWPGHRTRPAGGSVPARPLGGGRAAAVQALGVGRTRHLPSRVAVSRRYRSAVDGSVRIGSGVGSAVPPRRHSRPRLPRRPR